MVKNISINRKKIWSLTWPVMIGNLTVPMVGLTDTAIMGHMPDSKYIASLALGSIVFNFLYAGLNFLRSSTTGIVAQNHGGKKNQEILLGLLRPLIIAFITGLMIVTFKDFIVDISWKLLNPEKILKPYFEEYFTTRLLGITAGLMNIVFLGWFYGLQKPIFIILQLFTINLSNIGLSILFVIYLDFGIFGVALGSVFAQLLGLTISITIFFKFFFKKNIKFLNLKNLFSLIHFYKLFNISKDLFIRTICLLMVQAYLIFKAGAIGVNELAAIEVSLIIFSLSSCILDAFAHTAEATVGHAIGAKNSFLLNKSIKLTLEMSLIFSIFISLIWFCFEKNIIVTITDIIVLQNLIDEFWIYIIFTPIIAVFAFQLDGIFIGATLAKEMRNSMIISALIFYFLIEFINQNLNVKNIYFCFLIFLSLRSIILFYYLNKVFKLSKKVNYHD